MRVSRLLFYISFALTGPALAQTATGAQRSAVDHMQGAEMNATLSRTVDARKAKAGDEVTATLTQDVRANGRLLLLRGTVLVGRVTEAQARTRNADAGDARTDSRLGIEFEQAVLGDGRVVPVNATIQAVAAAEPAAASGARGSASEEARSPLGAGSRGVFGIEGMEIVATAATDGSPPLLVSSTGNVALKSGTQLLLVAHGERAVGVEVGAAAGSATGRAGAGG
jgi:hypothetical protein